MFVQNFIDMSAAVRELSWVQTKTQTHTNTIQSAAIVLTVKSTEQQHSETISDLS